eukprot:1178272-Prorocentrum_minimum.AAC.6
MRGTNVQNASYQRCEHPGRRGGSERAESTAKTDKTRALSPDTGPPALTPRPPVMSEYLIIFLKRFLAAVRCARVLVSCRCTTFSRCPPEPGRLFARRCFIAAD